MVYFVAGEEGEVGGENYGIAATCFSIWEGDY